jgi:hypothetical protein
MFFYYQNSLLASVVSIFGGLLVFMGLVDAVDEKYLIIGLGIALMICGKLISNRKAFKKWWKQVEDAGLEERMKTDIALAKAVYSKNPIRATLKKIESLNPAAAEAIREDEDYV